MSLGAWRLLSAWPEYLGLALVLALLGAWMERRMGGSRRAAAQRGLLLAVLCLALARPVLDGGGGLPPLLLVDRSASVDAESREALLAEAGSALADLPRLDFGSSDDSPLAAALDRAGRALPQGGRILLLSDGRWTEPVDSGLSEGELVDARGVRGLDGRGPSSRSPIEVAADMVGAGIHIDAVALPSVGGRDAAVTGIDLPPSFRAGERVDVQLRLAASESLAAELVLSRLPEDPDDAALELARRSLRLEPGETLLRLDLRPEAAGPLRIEARLEVEGDVRAGNDRLQAAAWVSPPMRVLLVGEGTGVIRLGDILTGAGMPATIMAPSLLPSQLSRLEAWDAMVLADVPAASLGVDQQQAVAAFASDLGRGLLLTAGRQSFLPGGWEHTPLAEIAPVLLDPPDRASREAVALVFMIDQSASMGSIEGRGAISKLALAREAALLAAEVLGPGDQVGVVTYDDAARWLLPPTEVGAGRSLAEIEAALAGLATGGGTRILAALELALPALATDVDLPTRHAVLLTDGRDFNTDSSQYLEVVRRARDRDISLSTIAIGSDADRDLLAQLARAGRGRFHWAAEPADLPRLAAQESEILRAQSQQTGRFQPAPPRAAASPLLAGIELDALPPVEGYLAVRPRPGAEVALELPAGDPLLATWQLGLGRVVAWMSDLGEAWAVDWPDRPAGRDLWLRSLRYASRPPDAGPPGLSIERAPGSARIEIDLLTSGGQPIDLADARLVMSTTPAILHQLPQTAPGRYAATIPLPPTPGAWPAAIQVESPQTVATLPLALSRPYPPELVPVPADRGQQALEALVALTSGRRYTSLPSFDDLADGSRPRIPLWPYLLAIALALLLLEVARITRSR